jgi:hypothetical protein
LKQLVSLMRTSHPSNPIPETALGTQLMSPAASFQLSKLGAKPVAMAIHISRCDEASNEEVGGLARLGIWDSE